MQDRILEIAEEGRHLSLFRGFICVSEGKQELGRVPLDDITAVIISANQASISKNIVTALTARNVAVIFCGKTYLPDALTLPYTGNYESALRMKLQIESSRPLCKQIWQRIVQEKIKNQALVLEWRGAHEHSGRLRSLVKRILSGDSSNVEAQAAKGYFSSLLGYEFKRDRFEDGENILFNYAYTILRSATARSIVAAGLLPALGVHHRGRLNPYALVDDLMEPYRPLADSIVAEIVDRDRDTELTPAVKRELASILRMDLKSRKGVSPLYEVLHNLALDLTHVYEVKKICLQFPKIILPCTQGNRKKSAQS